VNFVQDALKLTSCFIQYVASGLARMTIFCCVLPTVTLDRSVGAQVACTIDAFERRVCEVLSFDTSLLARVVGSNVMVALSEMVSYDISLSLPYAPPTQSKQ